MKKTISLLACIITFSFSALAQDVYLNKGDIAILKGEKSINIEFSYEGMKVGDYGKEEKFLKVKTDERNAKMPGTGEKFVQEWEADKKEKYEPRFIERFTEASKISFSKDAKYTLIFQTTWMDGGYSIGVAKKSAQIDARVFVVETADKTKKLLTFTIDRAEESMWRGAAFDNGDRISQAYMLAAKKLGAFIKKEIK